LQTEDFTHSLQLNIDKTSSVQSPHSDCVVCTKHCWQSQENIKLVVLYVPTMSKQDVIKKTRST